MPIHNWSSAPPGLFHHFHQRWSVAICDELNRGRLPEGYYALVEQNAIGLTPDVLTLERRESGLRPLLADGGVATVANAPPGTRFVTKADESAIYAMKANRVVVRSAKGAIVAALEIVSPGNKSTGHAIRSFVEKTLELLRNGVHVLVVDPFPPSPRDPEGIHKLVWDEIHEEPFKLPSDKPLTLASYVAGVPITAYVEPVAVGEVLRDMPLFIDPDAYVPVPLELTYGDAWQTCPRQLKEMVENPAR